MKPVLVSLGLAAGLAFSPLALAQAPATPAPAQPQQPQAPAPSTLQTSLAGLYVAVLQDAEGGVASVQNEAGENAVMVFLSPKAAETAKADMEGADMSVQVLPIMAILAQWNGPVAFESSAAEVENAKALAPEAESFMAPAYFITTEGNEIQIQTQGGQVITPILLSKAQADNMTTELEAQGLDASTVEIVPIEFTTVLNQIAAMETDVGYRLFSHPGTAEMIQSQSEAAAATEGGQP